MSCDSVMWYKNDTTSWQDECHCHIHSTLLLWSKLCYRMSQSRASENNLNLPQKSMNKTLVIFIFKMMPTRWRTRSRWNFKPASDWMMAWRAFIQSNRRFDLPSQWKLLKNQCETLSYMYLNLVYLYFIIVCTVSCWAVWPAVTLWLLSVPVLRDWRIDSH